MRIHNVIKVVLFSSLAFGCGKSKDEDDAGSGQEAPTLSEEETLARIGEAFALIADGKLYLKIDGVAGESIASKHAGEIELDSYSWGVSNSTTIGSAGGGAGTGKAVFSKLEFTAATSKASPLLMQAVATGKHLKLATLAVEESATAGKKLAAPLTIELTEVFVTSYKQSGEEGGEIGDAVELAFGKLKVRYVPLDAKGNPLPPVEAGWDNLQNKPL